MADRIVVMNEGRIEQVGTPDEVFHQPASAFVMDFLGHVNLFHGRVEAGRAVFGSLEVDAPAGLQIRGDRASLAVRPHDLEMGKDPQGRQSLRARVVRIQSAGPVVKVELLTETDQTVFVELSHERFRQEAYAVGDEVFLTPRDSRLFVDDYAT